MIATCSFSFTAKDVLALLKCFWNYRKGAISLFPPLVGKKHKSQVPTFAAGADDGLSLVHRLHFFLRSFKVDVEERRMGDHSLYVSCRHNATVSCYSVMIHSSRDVMTYCTPKTSSLSTSCGKVRVGRVTMDNNRCLARFAQNTNFARNSERCWNLYR